jgi:hypothetical protein
MNIYIVYQSNDCTENNKRLHALISFYPWYLLLQSYLSICPYFARIFCGQRQGKGNVVLCGLRRHMEFYVLLTVHLGTNPANNQLDAQYLCIYFTSLHSSSNPTLIIRRINCINTSGMCPSDRLVCTSGRKFLPDVHTRRSRTQSDSYQMLY